MKASFLLALFALSGTVSSGWTSTDGINVEDPIGQFRNTYYYVAHESEYGAEPRNTPLLDMQGNVLVRVGPKFARAVRMEGSGKLLDGRMLNYAGRVNDEVRYHFTRHPFGRAFGNCPLIPFRTIAVDPNRIELGSTVHIAETVGMKLPDGSVHDGIWHAADIGSAIKGDRIDIFIERKSNGVVLSQHGITHLKGLTVRSVSPKPVDSCVDQDPE